VNWNVPRGEHGDSGRNAKITSVNEAVQENLITHYDEGKSCTKISIMSGISFDVVYSIISRAFPQDNIRI